VSAANSSFSSEIVAANRIVNDESVLETFFEGLLPQLQAGGLRVKHSKGPSSSSSSPNGDHVFISSPSA
jgi:hypothetical protein